jgi:hypothetical protein
MGILSKLSREPEPKRGRPPGSRNVKIKPSGKFPEIMWENKNGEFRETTKADKEFETIIGCTQEDFDKDDTLFPLDKDSTKVVDYPHGKERHVRISETAEGTRTGIPQTGESNNDPFITSDRTRNGAVSARSEPTIVTPHKQPKGRKVRKGKVNP